METKARCDVVEIDFEKGTITIEVPSFITRVTAGTVDVDFKDIMPANSSSDRTRD